MTIGVRIGVRIGVKIGVKIGVRIGVKMVSCMVLRVYALIPIIQLILILFSTCTI